MIVFRPNRKKKVYEMASTFLLDASVLIFVFVPLDVVIQFGRTRVTMTAVVGSWIVAAVLFATAAIMAIAGDEL